MRLTGRTGRTGYTGNASDITTYFSTFVTVFPRFLSRGEPHLLSTGEEKREWRPRSGPARPVGPYSRATLVLIRVRDQTIDSVMPLRDYSCKRMFHNSKYQLMQTQPSSLFNPVVPVGLPRAAPHGHEAVKGSQCACPTWVMLQCFFAVDLRVRVRYSGCAEQNRSLGHVSGP